MCYELWPSFIKEVMLLVLYVKKAFGRFYHMDEWPEPMHYALHASLLSVTG